MASFNIFYGVDLKKKRIRIYAIKFFLELINTTKRTVVQDIVFYIYSKNHPYLKVFLQSIIMAIYVFKPINTTINIINYFYNNFYPPPYIKMTLNSSY